ncbi:acid-sensing ion channel 2-like [Babylonia areolata]|uniref:acid-sensing ion channel 2-like n=1 Tax=Babylonia areolata TaxID=304850 RepID=UPI003FD35735
MVDFYVTYTAYPYTTSVTVLREPTLTFPAVTICLKSPFDKTRLLSMRNGTMLMEYVLSMTELNNPFPPKWTSEDLNQTFGNLSFTEVFANASVKPSDVIVWAYFGSERTNVAHDFEVYWSTFETCFSFNRHHPMADSEERKVKPLETFEVLMKLNESRLLPTTTTGVMYRFLGKPFFSYGGEDCVDTEDPLFRSPLGFNRSFTWRNCIFDAATRAAVQKCQCVTMSGKEEEIAAQQGGDSANGTRVLCTTQCAFTEYDHKLKLMPFPSRTFKKFYLDANSFLSEDFFDAAAFLKLEVSFENPLVTVMEHQPAIHVADICSTLGGQMGLFLGASLLTLTELIEILLSLFCTFVSHCYHRWNRPSGNRVTSLPSP